MPKKRNDGVNVRFSDGAGYVEAKQENDPAVLAASRKLAPMFIEMILKTDPKTSAAKTARS